MSGAAGQAVNPAAQPAVGSSDPNELTLVVDGKKFTGWMGVRISRGIEQFPSAFDLTVTERNPFQAGEISIGPGQSCQVLIGTDVIVTGWVDRYRAAVSPSQHTVMVQGRGKCSDLVDCSAGIFPDGTSRGMVITASSLLALAQQLATPFNIGVNSLTGDDIPVALSDGTPVQFSIILTETPYNVMERVARYAGVLVYEATDGSVVLARVGSRTAASGFTQGMNVQNAAVSFANDERYSVYIPRLFSTDDLQNGVGGQIKYQNATDTGITRFRPLVVVSDQVNDKGFLVEQCAVWERNRRFGRSQALAVTADSWRDTAGKLWEPNTFAPIDIPTLKLPSKSWIISSVSFIRDEERGTVADLVLMPKEAFAVQPTALLPFDWQVGKELKPGGGAAANPNAPVALPPRPGLA